MMLGRWFGHESEALVSGMNVIIKETPQRSGLFLHVRTKRREATCELGRCASPGTVSAPWTFQSPELIYPTGLRKPHARFSTHCSQGAFIRKMTLVLACLKYPVTLRNYWNSFWIPRALWSDSVPSRLLVHPSPAQGSGPRFLTSLHHSAAKQGPCRLAWLRSSLQRLPVCLLPSCILLLKSSCCPSRATVTAKPTWISMAIPPALSSWNSVSTIGLIQRSLTVPCH